MKHFVGRFGQFASVVVLVAALSACHDNSPPLPDTTAPTITSTTPIDSATGVATNTTVASNMSEAIDAATAGLTLVATGGGAVVGTVTVTGAVVMFTPLAALTNSTQYTARLTGATADLAGNPLGTDSLWSFTTAAPGDTTPPTVGTRNPANTMTGVATNTTVSIVLDEALDPATVTAGALTLVNGGSVAGTVSLSNGNRTITFTPDAALAAGAGYTATLAGTVTDVAGNALGADDIWSFTTAGVAASLASVVYTIDGPPISMRRADIDNQTVFGTDMLSDPGWANDVDESVFAISPDGTQVAMLTRADSASPWEIYVVPVAGGIPVKVSGRSVANVAVRDFEWSPDSTQIAYLASEGSTFSDDLYVVTVDGLTEDRVNPDLVAGGRVAAFRWSPDGSRIAYAVDRFVQGDWRLVISTPDGTGSDTVVPKLDGYPVRPGRDRMAWSPDGSRIAYIGRLAGDERLLVVGVNGLTPAYLSTPAFSNSNYIAWAPDGIAVASILISGGSRLVVSPADGSAFTAATTTPPGYVRYVAWAPDSSRIAYSMSGDLFVDAPDGNSLVKVSAPLGATAGVGRSFQWSPDSGTLLFFADPLSLAQIELYTVSRTGTNLIQLTDRLSSGTFGGAVFSPDGTMAYAAWYDGSQRVVHSIALDGSSEASVIDPLLTGNVWGFQVIDSAGISRVIQVD